jgi:hypothetical protein
MLWNSNLWLQTHDTQKISDLGAFQIFWIFLDFFGLECSTAKFVQIHQNMKHFEIQNTSSPKYLG